MHTAVANIVRGSRDLPVVIDCCRGDDQVVFSYPIEQLIQVNHLPAAVQTSTPEKRHLLDRHVTVCREIGVANNLIVVVDSQSYAHIATPPVVYTAQRSEIDHL